MQVTKRFHAEEMEMNITPMIDVVFQLLIFFIVVSEIASQDRVDGLTLPAATQAKEEQVMPDRLVINIARRERVDAKDGQRKMLDVVYISKREKKMVPLIWVSKTKKAIHPDDEVGKHFRVERKYRAVGEAEESKQPILFVADRFVQWKTVQDVMERAGLLGFRKLSFSVKMAEGVTGP